MYRSIFTKIFLKRTLFACIVVIAIALLSFVAMRSYIHWTESSYYGEIVEITNEGFLVKETETIVRTVFLTEHTLIKRGRHSLNNGLNVGDKVIIIGSPDGAGRIEAKLIRLIGDRGQDQ